MFFKSPGKNKTIIYLFIFSMAFLFVLDRLFKFLASNAYFEKPIKVIADYFSLNYAPNFNIAFSLPVKGSGLTILIIILILILFYYLFDALKNKQARTAIYLGFVILGALSNLSDRLEFGFVIDYLDVKYFTVFNIADIMIVGGALGLLWLNLRANKK